MIEQILFFFSRKKKQENIQSNKNPTPEEKITICGFIVVERREN